MALTKVTGQVIKNTTDVTVGVLTVTNTLAVGGTVSIGGTLTYEDVTNVDAVGLITARDGIKVGSGITLSVDGDGFFTGVITATSYSGIDLSDVTGATGDFSIADKIIHTGDTDTAIRFPAANTVSVETAGVERVEITGTEVVFNDTGTDTDFRIEGDSNANLVKVDAGNDRVGVGVASPQQVFHVYHASDNGLALFESGDANCRIDLKDNSGQASVEAIGNDLRFGTSSSNTERLRIEGSSGRIGIQGSPTKGVLDVRASGGSADKLTAVFGANEGQSGGSLSDNTDKACRIGSYHYDTDEEPYAILVASGTNGANALNFGGGTSLMNAATQIQFTTASNSTTTSGTTRMIINSSGYVNIGSNSDPRKVLDITGPDGRSGASPGNSDTALVIDNDGGNGAIMEFCSDNNAYGRIFFTDTDSSNQGGIIYKHADDSLNFQTNGSEKFSIASDGDVTISPTGDPRLILTGSGHPQLTLTNTTGADHCGINFGDNDDVNAGMIQYTNSSNIMVFHTNGSERYRIHSDGKQSWNNTSFPYGETFHFYNGLEGSCASFYQNSSNDHTGVILRHGRALSGYNGYQMLFKNSSGTNVGSIISGNSSTSFNTSSDYRIKENQITISNAIDKLNKLKPYEFNFKDDPDYKHLGFFAHEVQEIIPNGVAYGEKDEVYTEDSPSESDDYKKGDMKIQSLDYGKLTPLLTAALQEAIVEIESLKAKVAVLEG